MDNINFSDWLVSEMEVRGWNQADLARKAGLSRQVISRYINQTRTEPNTEMITALAHALGYPPEHIFRQAGLLPPKKGAADPAFDRFEARLALLTPENRERIYRLIELEYQLQLESEQRSEQARLKSAGAKPAEAS